VYFLLLAHIAYFVAFHSAINVQYRFICPITPYMILLAGLPVYAWRHRAGRGSDVDLLRGVNQRVRT
jgi:hypothetical protein